MLRLCLDYVRTPPRCLRITPACVNTMRNFYQTKFVWCPQVVYCQYQGQSVVGSQPLCTSMRHWLWMKNGNTPLAPRRLSNLGKLEALSMFRLQRQYPNICKFNVVLPIAQSLGNQQTPTSDDDGTSLETGNLRASLRGLKEPWILGPKKGDTSRVPDDVVKKRKFFLLYGVGGIGKTQICLKFLEDMSDQ